MSYKGKLNFVGHSDKGMVRPNNEDCIGTDLETGLVVVADGMGGYKAGEVASGIAVQTLNEFITNGIKDAHKHPPGADNYSAESVLLRNAILRANDIIHQTAKSQPQCEGMGTTIVACLFYNNRVSIAHVGDSRMYRIRHGKFEQVTTDHSLLQELVARGFYTPEEARKSLNKNLVTRALGIEPTVEVEAKEAVLFPNKTNFFAWNGLKNMVKTPIFT